MVSVLLLGFVGCSDLLKLALVVFISLGFCFFGWHVLTRHEVCVVLFNVTVELPDKYTVLAANGNDLTIVPWVKNYSSHRVGVSYEALEVVWMGSLSLIIPNFDQVVIATSQEVS